LGGFAGGTNENGLFNLSAHAFKRNWEKGFIGITGSVTSGTTNHDWYSDNGIVDNGKVIGRLGIEGSKYWNKFNISGVIGAEHDYENSHTGLYDRLGVDYYITENFKAGIFQQYTGHRNGGGLRAEYLFKADSDTPLSAYAEAADGKNYPLTFTVGLRVLFGAAGNRNLQTRDRHDYVEDFIPQRWNDHHHREAPPAPAVIPPGGGGGNN
jgi:hypothetical protein